MKLKSVVVETNPMLIHQDSYQTNPMYLIEPVPVTESSPEVDIFLQPDEIDDDETVLHLFETMVTNNGEPLETLIEQVKGTPLYGSMMKLSEAKRQELVIKLKMKKPTEVENIISRLRRVKRASLDQTSTTAVKIRVQMRWQGLVEKLLFR